jgi:hypothetical protein
MTFQDIAVLTASIIGIFVTGGGALIAVGAWILGNHHKTKVEPAVTKLTHSLERTIDATEANTQALAKSQGENRDAFDGIHELVADLRKEQHQHGEKLSEHGARLDGHDVELRDIKQAVPIRATKARRVVK